MAETDEQMQAELERLRAENEGLKARRSQEMRLQVSQKGAVSLYGIRRFPITTDNSINPLTWADVDEITDDLTGGITISPLGFDLNGAVEWDTVLGMADEVRTFISQHETELKRK